MRELFGKSGVGVHAYIVPSQDTHQSEFIVECYARRAYISGFTGSAGTFVVTRDEGALWTDGCFFLQAEKQLSSCWILMRAGNVGVPTTAEWLNDVLHPGCKVGIDPFLFSYDAAEELREDLSKKNNELVLLYDMNLVDEIWKQTTPKPPGEKVRLHDLKYTGVDVPSILSSLRSQLADAGCAAIVICRLDEIAWLLNLGGTDVPHSPVVYAYLVVGIDKVPTEVMHAVGVELRPYESILDEVENLALEGACLWIDGSLVNAAIVNTFKTGWDKHLEKLSNKKKDVIGTHGVINGKISGPTGVYRSSPVAVAKAVKNQAEIDRMRSSHLRDAAALAELWAWLEDEILMGGTLTEVEVADQLLEFRSKQDGFVDTSFDTIIASGANGAIIHYKPEPDSCRTVHGVEAALNVHEGPQSISSRFGNMTPLEKGMIVSNEPGCYEDQSFGIHIENFLCVREMDTPNRFGGIGYLGFERLTFVPIQVERCLC
ncbi:Aminopeptidase P2-like protein [Drosera capensis]